MDANTLNQHVKDLLRSCYLGNWEAAAPLYDALVELGYPNERTLQLLRLWYGWHTTGRLAVGGRLVIREIVAWVQHGSIPPGYYIV